MGGAIDETELNRDVRLHRYAVETRLPELTRRPRSLRGDAQSKAIGTRDTRRNLLHEAMSRAALHRDRSDLLDEPAQHRGLHNGVLDEERKATSRLPHRHSHENAIPVRRVRCADHDDLVGERLNRQLPA